jgi:hypothetical protein
MGFGNNYLSVLNRTLIILFISLIVFPKNISAQGSVCVLHLKDGKEMMGNTVKDTINNLYIVRNSELELFEIPFEEVNFITKPEFVVKAPEHNISPPYGFCVPCRTTSFYFADGALTAMKGKKFYLGAELAGGFRLSSLNLGLGFGFWSIKEKLRFPVFLHIKYYPWEVCYKPFLLFNAGLVFDSYTSKYHQKPFVKIANGLSPKMIGGGIGFEIPVLDYMSITIDGGYRYIVVSNEIGMNTCDGIKNVIGYSELHTGYLRIGVSF